MLNKIKSVAVKGAALVVNAVSQAESRQNGSIDDITPGMPELLREAATEGAVLLKNDGVLPFSKNKRVAVFGRCQIDWFYVGYGSGGDVVRPYAVNLLKGIENVGATVNEEVFSFYKEWCEKNPPDHGFWGHWPRCYPEAPVSDDLIKAAAKQGDSAVVVIGRSAGEDRENVLEKGSFYLADDEKSLLSRVSTSFKNTAVLLNVGNVTDFSEILSFCKGNTALLLLWQGGMESGNAAAELIFGDKTPSGKMISTVAKKYDDYPSFDSFGQRDFNNFKEDIFVGYRFFESFKKDSVLFPFGFGLSYTSFKTEVISTKKDETAVTLKIRVKNTGDTFSGREVSEVYCEPPKGALSKPSRVLCAFLKTDELLPGEEKEYTLSFPLYYISSFDDSGKSGHKSCYILEKGTYSLYVGSDVQSAKCEYTFELDSTNVLKELTQCGAPKEEFLRTVAIEKDGALVPGLEAVPTTEVDLKRVIVDLLPENGAPIKNRGFLLGDVKSGKCTLKEFTSQLSLRELEAISRGDYRMNSPLGPAGNAGALGGVLPSLRKKGVLPLITTDGPSGIRLKSTCSLLPIGSLLSSTWNEKLVFDVYKKLGEEMKSRGSDILLAPGMNIHRNPLCGRNFEYYSEDPLLSGKIAAAVVKGLCESGVSACPKHFACNSQETNRTKTDSRLSERALREIYLKNFEICVTEGKPAFIMTSYNKINGVWGHYNYDLCTRILRGEWGFDGCVITDWWMQKSCSPEFPSLYDNAYRVRAGVDVLMPGGKRAGLKIPDGTLLSSYGKKDGMTLGELRRTAENVLGAVLKLKY